MKRLILTLALASLVLPAAALGKGPSAATMDGPGGGGGITFSGDDGSGALGALTLQSGWFAAAFGLGQEPNPMLAGRPKGDLGPKYILTYTVPGGGSETYTIRQEIYPYANPGPVTYMPPGQPTFDMETRGGWFQAGPELKETLVSAGLPARAPTGSFDGSSFPTTTVSLLALALLVLTVSAVRVRRRARPAAA